MEFCVEPYNEIPSPPKLPLIGHLPLLMKGRDRLDKLFEDLRVEYGDIFKVDCMQQLTEKFDSIGDAKQRGGIMMLYREELPPMIYMKLK